MATSLIEYSSPYLASLNLTEADAQQITQLIKAASSWVSTYCNRQFAQAEFDKVLTVQQDQSILLPNPPIAYISRIMTATGNWLTIQNTQATTASYSTSSTGLQLVSITAGVRVNTFLPYASYPSLSALAGAVNDVEGWTASVVSGFGNWASADLVASQAGNCRQGAPVLVVWNDDARQVSFDPRLGVIEGPGGIGWMEPYPKVWNTIGSASFFSFYGFSRFQQVRVIYTAGYTPDCVPEEIKEVVANLVISAFTNPEGRQNMLTIGGEYNYTLSDIEQLAKSDKKVLSFHRDRWV